MALPQFKTGRYSKHLPSRLTERYHESLADPELLVLREEVALLDARLSDLLSKVDTGESGALWKQVEAAFKNYRTVRGGGNPFEVAKRWNELETAIEKGRDEYAAWGEITTILDQRRRLVESERKRQVEAEQVITVEKAMILVSALADIVKQHVTDRIALANISQAIARLVTVDSDAIEVSGG